MMLVTPTTATTAFVATYDQNGKIGALLCSQPAQPFANNADQGSTTAEKYKDKVTLSADGLAQSQPEEAGGNKDASAAEATDSGRTELQGEQATPNQEQAAYETSAGTRSERSAAITEQPSPSSNRRQAQDLFA